MWVSEAYAEEAVSQSVAVPMEHAETSAAATDPALQAGYTEASPLTGVFPLLVILVVFYFLLIRPQQKKIREHDAMIKGLRRGDKIVTAGGVIGTIHKVDADDVLVVEVAPDIKIRVVRDTVSAVLTKTIANDNKAEDKARSK